MQTQKSKEVLATSKQIDFIRNLQKRGFLGNEINLASLAKSEASTVIDLGLATAKEAALSDGMYEENKASEEAPQIPPQREEFNKIRFGMCAKLVYSKQDFNLEHPTGAKDFKSEIQRLYQILSEMERSLAASFSSSRVEFLHSYMKKNNIRMEAD